MRKLRLAGLTVLGAAALSSPLWGPRVLREIPWFEVRRVEISGTRLVAPHQALAASGVERGRNLWAELGEVEAALSAHPAIEGAVVRRRLPHTLRIRIEEKRPIAYVEAGALSPVTSRGEILPVEPARLDLPVIRGDWSKATPALRGALLAETERLARTDPALLAHVSEIRGVGKTLEHLVLTHSLAEITLPVGVTPERLAQLRAVLEDLERRLPAAVAEDGPASSARVDLRYEEQIVVRLPSSV